MAAVEATAKTDGIVAVRERAGMLASLLCIAILCAALFATSFITPSLAWADDELVLTNPELEELNEVVEAKTEACADQQAIVDDLADRADEERSRLDQIDVLMPIKQKQAERSVCERYKVQRQYGSLIEALLYAQDWQSFVSGIEYIAIASRAHIEELVDMREEKANREQVLAELDAQKAQAEEELDRLLGELDEATKARDEKKRLLELVANTKLNPDGADRSAGEKAFVGEWAPRLDRFLANSPLAGQGKVFAKSAWSNNIDPRFSAAISNIESGKGLQCIRPHNAWGWGAAEPNPYGLASEWATWEDAIEAHAKGLAHGYGYSPTPESAQKYCPPNWELWYVSVVNDMNSM